MNWLKFKLGFGVTENPTNQTGIRLCMYYLNTYKLASSALGSGYKTEHHKI
jgi:hypothetical protein